MDGLAVCACAIVVSLGGLMVASVRCTSRTSEPKLNGWLGAGAEYSRGAVPPEFMERLIRFTRHWGESTRALGWPYACGFHTCEFCGEFNASGNFGVPSTSVLYVCPEMIVHYIAVHEYQPPPEFVDAVLAAPLPGTAAYKRAVEGFRDGEL
jgi:hypothetical protein